MNIKCDMGPEKVVVFISSAMNNKHQMARREAVQAYLSRVPFFHYFAIEEIVSSDNVSTTYANLVIGSDIAIFILSEELRQAVVDEFDIATRNKKID